MSSPTVGEHVRYRLRTSRLRPPIMLGHQCFALGIHSRYVPNNFGRRRMSVKQYRKCSSCSCTFQPFMMFVPSIQMTRQIYTQYDCLGILPPTTHTAPAQQIDRIRSLPSTANANPRTPCQNADSRGNANMLHQSCLPKVYPHTPTTLTAHWVAPGRWSLAAPPVAVVPGPPPLLARPLARGASD
jgi:hypothetical protein